MKRKLLSDSSFVATVTQTVVYILAKLANTRALFSKQVHVAEMFCVYSAFTVLSVPEAKHFLEEPPALTGHSLYRKEKPKPVTQQP